MEKCDHVHQQIESKKRTLNDEALICAHLLPQEDRVSTDVLGKRESVVMRVASIVNHGVLSLIHLLFGHAMNQCYSLI